MITAICIIAALVMAASIFLALISRPSAALIGWLPLLLLHFYGDGTSGVWFWLGASIIATVIYILLPAEVRSSRHGVAYMTVGGVTATLVALLISTAAIIPGAVIGVALGGIAYGRTPAGKGIAADGRKFFNYLCAKGLPLVVVCSEAGLTITAIYLLTSH